MLSRHFQLGHNKFVAGRHQFSTGLQQILVLVTPFTNFFFHEFFDSEKLGAVTFH